MEKPPDPPDMSVETIRTNSEHDDANTAGIIDVSELSTARVQSIVVDEEVYLKRRGDRTFLVPA